MGFFEASFGIHIADHNDINLIFKLLFKNIWYWKDNIKIDYELNILFDHLDKSTTPFEIDIDSIEFIPYDDYLSNGKQLNKIIINNIDDFENFFNDIPNNITFDNIQLLSTGGCHTTLGFGSVSIYANNNKVPISIKQMIDLQILHNKLLEQGRIDGGYVLAGNCCS
jgi:hypothetical protein